jgi:hypothetical protein
VYRVVFCKRFVLRITHNSIVGLEDMAPATIWCKGGLWGGDKAWGEHQVPMEVGDW